MGDQASRTFRPPVGNPPSIELIPTTGLKIDRSYQRSISTASSQRLIARIAEQWDWRLCVPLLVSRRDGGLYVIDGQHRLEGARRRGDILYLPCCVSEYGSPAQEAEVFCRANESRRKIGRIDQWRAALLAGDENAAAVDRVVSACGLQLVETSLNGLAKGQINALGVVRTLIADHGEEKAAQALGIVTRAFSDFVVPSIGTFAGAVASLIRQQLVPDAIEGALKLHTPWYWQDAAKIDPEWSRGGTYRERAMRQAILAEIDAQKAAQRENDTATASGGGGRPAKRPATFEEQLAAVAAGRGLVERFKPPRDAGSMTLGGVASGML